MDGISTNRQANWGPLRSGKSLYGFSNFTTYSQYYPSYAVDDDEMTLWLLDHGADPNKQCSIDLTPLSYAVEQASLPTVKLLLDRGGDVHKGQLLHHAVERQTDTIEVLGMLLKRGAPLNSKMYENHYSSWRLYYFMGLGTALHKAAELGKADVLRYLLDQGADVSIKDATNRSARDWAALNNHQEAVELLQSVERRHRLWSRLSTKAGHYWSDELSST